MKYYQFFITGILIVFASQVFATNSYNLFSPATSSLSKMNGSDLDENWQQRVGTVIGKVKYNINIGKSLNDQSYINYNNESKPIIIFDFMGEEINLIVTSINSKGKSYSYSASNPDNFDHINISESNGSMLGSFHYKGKLYKFYPANNGDTLIMEMPNMRYHSEDYTEPKYSHNVRSEKLDSSDFSDSGDEYTVIIAYTSEFASDVVNIDAYMNLLEQETNQSYINSKINTRVRIVHYYQTNYQEVGDTEKDLAALRNADLPATQELNNLRDQYNADIKVLFIGNNALNNNRQCGIARIRADESTALAVVVAACGTGNYSFGHEIGHLFGADHEITQVIPGPDDIPYGHGYCLDQPSIPRTIMAIPDCGPLGVSPSTGRIQYWSNPNIIMNDEAIGSADIANNARVHNERAIIVANFRREESSNSQILSNGQSISISQPTRDAENRYYVDVPAGAKSLNVQMSGGSGDADLYVNFGRESTTSDYNCRPYRDGNNEACQFNHPGAGRWYVMVRSWSPYSGVSLSAKVNTESNESEIPNACQDGQTPVGNVRLTAGNAVCLEDASDGDQRQMSFHVSDENVGKTLEIILSHGSGNGDLLHRYDNRPTRTVYDNISNGPSNEERILVHDVQRSWNYIHIRANPEFSGVTLLPRYID